MYSAVVTRDKGIAILVSLLIISGYERVIQLLSILRKDVTSFDQIEDGTLRQLRAMVSKRKKRYQSEGHDLDLTYISDRVIAMGYPSEGCESLFRNPMESVKLFLQIKHSHCYRVYNLCSEQGEKC